MIVWSIYIELSMCQILIYIIFVSQGCLYPACPAQIAVIDQVFYILTEDKPSMIMLDPSKRLFKDLPPPAHKHVHSAVTVLKGHLYVTGGLNNSKPSRLVQRFDPQLQEWCGVKSMTTSRTFHGCVTISFN